MEFGSQEKINGHRDKHIGLAAKHTHTHTHTHPPTHTHSWLNQINRRGLVTLSKTTYTQDTNERNSSEEGNEDGSVRRTNRLYCTSVKNCEL